MASFRPFPQPHSWPTSVPVHMPPPPAPAPKPTPKPRPPAAYLGAQAIAQGRWNTTALTPREFLGDYRAQCFLRMLSIASPPDLPYFVSLYEGKVPPGRQTVQGWILLAQSLRRHQRRGWGEECPAGDLWIQYACDVVVDACRIEPHDQSARRGARLLDCVLMTLSPTNPLVHYLTCHVGGLCARPGGPLNCLVHVRWPNIEDAGPVVLLPRVASLAMCGVEGPGVIPWECGARRPFLMAYKSGGPPNGPSSYLKITGTRKGSMIALIGNTVDERIFEPLPWDVWASEMDRTEGPWNLFGLVLTIFGHYWRHYHYTDAEPIVPCKVCKATSPAVPEIQAILDHLVGNLTIGLAPGGEAGVIDLVVGACRRAGSTLAGGEQVPTGQVEALAGAIETCIRRRIQLFAYHPVAVPKVVSGMYTPVIKDHLANIISLMATCSAHPKHSK